ncbi:MAG: hypothetical protein H7Y14_02375, partial [Burkholderiales bacterium]|nr:hypothetical protein [Burkholderiales bacterium]
MLTVLRSRIAVAALIASCAASLAAAQERRIEELARKSGLWEQVTQMRAQMKGGIGEARNQAKAAGKPLLDDGQFARLSAAIDRTFAPETL